MLTAWAASALVGPSILTNLRGNSYVVAAKELAGRCDPDVFRAKFGAGQDQLQSLIDAKTVTIARLLEIAPPGTLDPTPGIYDTTMYAMAGIMGCALVCNALIRPFPEDSEYFLDQEDEKGGQGSAAELHK